MATAANSDGSSRLERVGHPSPVAVADEVQGPLVAGIDRRRQLLEEAEIVELERGSGLARRAAGFQGLVDPAG